MFYVVFLISDVYTSMNVNRWHSILIIPIFIKNYNTKVISIDLPEANLLSSYYLKETFPEKKIFLYEDLSLYYKYEVYFYTIWYFIIHFIDGSNR